MLLLLHKTPIFKRQNEGCMQIVKITLLPRYEELFNDITGFLIKTYSFKLKSISIIEGRTAKIIFDNDRPN